MQALCVGGVTSFDDGALCWGAALEGQRSRSGWQSVAEELCAAGIAPEGEETVLFTDALGLHPVYLRRQGSAVFFASRVEPLVGLPGTLTVDWDAWASILVMGSPHNTRTPFSEIERLEAGHGLAVGREGRIQRVSFTPLWLTAAIGEPTPAQLTDAVRSALPLRSMLKRPPAIPLSGGWDSRLLAVLSRGKYRRRAHAWTTGQDDGRDLDLAYAPAVAQQLGLAHTIVPQPASGWVDLAEETRSRVGYETWLHTWLIPLCRRMRDQEEDVLDGLAGDVLIKGLFVDAEVLDGDSPTRLERLYGRLGGRRDRFLGRLKNGAAEQLLSSARRSFLETAARFDGHMNQLALSVLHTRTARAIALSPLRLFSPEMKTWLPFTHPRVLAHALAIPPGRKTGGRLYRSVLETTGSAVARLPSTNDDAPPVPRRHSMLQSSPEAIGWMVESILTCETTTSLLDGPFLAGLDRREPIFSDFQGMRLVQGLSLLSQWIQRYRNELTLDRRTW